MIFALQSIRGALDCHPSIVVQHSRHTSDQDHANIVFVNFRVLIWRLRTMRVAANALLWSFLAAGCAELPYTPPNPYVPPTWSNSSAEADAEYIPYMAAGTSTIRGQAFMSQQGGGVVRAAGRTVTLDPATTTGKEWWEKAGSRPRYSDENHPAPNFLKARRTTTADADGRFTFSGIPEGSYYIRTSVSWQISTYSPGLGSMTIPQGGVIGKMTYVAKGATLDVILANNEQLIRP